MERGSEAELEVMEEGKQSAPESDGETDPEKVEAPLEPDASPEGPCDENSSGSPPINPLDSTVIIPLELEMDIFEQIEDPIPFGTDMEEMFDKLLSSLGQMETELDTMKTPSEANTQENTNYGDTFEQKILEAESIPKAMTEEIFDRAEASSSKLEVKEALLQAKSEEEEAVPKYGSEKEEAVPKSGSEKEEAVPKADSEKEEAVPKAGSEKEEAVPKADSEKEEAVIKAGSEKEEAVPKSGSEKEEAVPKAGSEKEEAVPKSGSEEEEALPKSGSEKEEHVPKADSEKEEHVPKAGSENEAGQNDANQD